MPLCPLYIADPFQIDSRGKTAEVDYEHHVAAMIGEVLFTKTGERVNRPDFGADLMALNFEGASDLLVATLQMRARSEIERWLGDLVSVTDIIVEAIDGLVIITVTYVLRRTGCTTSTQFIRRSLQ
jgi:phage baseplate assembly protein W